MKKKRNQHEYVYGRPIKYTFGQLSTKVKREVLVLSTLT